MTDRHGTTSDRPAWRSWPAWRTRAVLVLLIVLIVLIVLLSLAGAPGGRQAPGRVAVEPCRAGGARGVLVETVEPGSVLAAAGVAAGDLLRRWDAAPQAAAHRPAAAGGALCSTFDWEWLTVEQAPRGTVRLSGERAGKPLAVEVPQGSWRARVRPLLSAPLEEGYRQAAPLLEAGTTARGDALLARLERTAQAAGEGTAGAWLAMERGRRWAAAKDPRRALSCYRAALGQTRDPRIAVAVWRAIARAGEEQGEIDAARSSFRSARELAAAAWGESLELAASERDLGKLAFNAGDLRLAGELFGRAAGLFARLAPHSLAFAGALSNQGTVATNLGQLASGEAAYHRALALFERLRARREMPPLLNNLAILAVKRGQYSQAEGYYRRALEIWQELEPESARVATVLNNLGSLAITRGDWEEARRDLDRARGLYEIRSPFDPGLNDVLDLLGELAAARGDLELAEGYWQLGLARRQKLEPGSFRISVSLNHLGDLAGDRGDLELAAQDHRRALEILEKTAPGNLDTAATLVSLARAERLRSAFAAADRHCERAIRILAAAAPGSLQLGGALLERGRIALASGALERARRSAEQGLALAEARAPASAEAAALLASLGELAERRGDRPAAFGFLQRALGIAERSGPDSFETANLLHALGRLEQRRHPAAAVAYLRRAVEAVEHEVEHLGSSPGQRMDFRAERETCYQDLIEQLLANRRPEEAFAVLERSRGRGLLEMLAQRDLAFALDVPPALRRERRRIALAYEQTQRRISDVGSPAGDGRYEQLTRQLRDLRRQHDEIELRIHHASPRLAALQHPQPLDFPGARRALDPGTVMLAYSVGRDRTDLFVVAPGAPLATLAVAAGEQDLRRAVERLRALIPLARTRSGAGRMRQESFAALARRLFRLLVEPASPAVAAAERVLIVPDGPLHVLPWSALIRATPRQGGRGWQYMAEWKPVHLALSATVYAELKQARHPGVAPQAAKLAAFGDPVFPHRETAGESGAGADLRLRSAVERGLSFAPLPWSRDEVQGIGRIHPRNALLYLAEAATEERAKSIGKDVRYVHFATHTTLDEGSPLDSAVVLTIPTRVADGHDNGLLQAWEILDGVRLDAELVVLSGCGSGLGRELRGEGLLGLTRAFQYAGARSVMASLWSIADQTTARLMVDFYRHLFAGQSKDEALRQAQLELIRHPAQPAGASGAAAAGDPSAPFYWAAFQVYGDWR